MLNLVIFYHYMTLTVPSWCNLKLQQCSINIIQTLHSVCIHIEDLTIFVIQRNLFIKGNVDSKDLFPLNYDFFPYEKYNCSLVIWFFPLNFLKYLSI